MVAGVGKIWDFSPEFLKVFPSIELTQQVRKAAISQILEQPEGAAKHFLLAALYVAASETPLADRELKSFHNDFSQWQKVFLPSANEDPCAPRLYSRCTDLLKNHKQLTGSGQLLNGKIYFTLRQYEPAAVVLAQVRGNASENAE